MSGIAIGVIATTGIVGFAVAYVVFRTARLNRDPLQHELADLLGELLASGFSDSAVTLFHVGTTNRFVRHMVLEEGEQQTRLAHALSMMRPNLTSDGYEALRRFLRTDDLG